MNLGNRQRIWRKALVQLGVLKKIEGTENLYECGPAIDLLEKVVRYRVQIADQRLAFKANGDVEPGRRARYPSDADVSASATSSGDISTAMETDTESTRPKPPTAPETALATNTSKGSAT